MSDDILVINQGLEQRTSSTGKIRYTMRMKAEPVVFNLDPKTLGRPVAEAIMHLLRERVRGIAAVAAPATLEFRKKAERAFKRGAPWAMKRFAGGRTGSKRPNQSDRLFNDSGRFADSITGNASSDGSWRINVAANRLSGDPTAVQRIWARLVELVPEFGDPNKLMENDLIRAAVGRATKDAIKKARMTTGKLLVRGARELVEMFETVNETLAG